MNIYRWFAVVLLAFTVSASAFTSQKNEFEYYRVKVRDFQLLASSYSANPDSVSNEARRLMPELKKHRIDILYFGVWDMYIQTLYLTGHQLKAQDELQKMFDEIKTVNNPEAEVHVYIAQGMLQQRFGNNIEAVKTLEKGLRICPSVSQCRYPRNLLTLYRWLIQTYLHDKSNYQAALKLCDKQERVYQEIMKRNLGDEFNRDHVMILSQRASVLIGLKRTAEAKRLIDSCEKMILPNVSPISYMPYYEALMAYYETSADYDKALLLCKKLINHFKYGYKPLQRFFMLTKAQILMKAGRKEEAAVAYQEYEKFYAEFDRIRVTNDIQEMNVQYHVHKLEMQNERWRNYMTLLTAGIIILIIFICITVCSNLRTKRKNRIIVERLDDMRIFLRPARDAANSKSSNNNDIVNRFKDYVEAEEHLRNGDLNVSQIASDLGVSVGILTKCLHSETGLYPSEYLVKSRLEAARHELITRIGEPVQSVAYSCGYNTLRTFQRQFNAEYGMSPSAYRAAFIEKNNHQLQE